MRYMDFELSEGSDGVTTLDAMAATPAGRHAEVLAEAQAVLAWCRREFPHTQGPVDEGLDWDHDLHVGLEDGGWHTVSLTLTGSPRFVEAFLAAFGTPPG